MSSKFSWLFHKDDLFTYNLNHSNGQISTMRPTLKRAFFERKNTYSRRNCIYIQINETDESVAPHKPSTMNSCKALRSKLDCKNQNEAYFCQPSPSNFSMLSKLLRIFDQSDKNESIVTSCSGQSRVIPNFSFSLRLNKTRKRCENNKITHVNYG